ncbi:unnamed protein product [Brachionus calyciflorus]|uniref:Uncharacterized protein n=1 Tax=Brachionus calyciflorus TaxID=104777 RepID=A0A813MKR9_9BILA|nr:unnamed protein product [Brachionus calyciflorus]
MIYQNASWSLNYHPYALFAPNIYNKIYNKDFDDKNIETLKKNLSPEAKRKNGFSGKLNGLLRKKQNFSDTIDNLNAVDLDIQSKKEELKNNLRERLKVKINELKKANESDTGEIQIQVIIPISTTTTTTTTTKSTPKTSIEGSFNQKEYSNENKRRPIFKESIDDNRIYKRKNSIIDVLRLINRKNKKFNPYSKAKNVDSSNKRKYGFPNLLSYKKEIKAINTKNIRTSLLERLPDSNNTSNLRFRLQNGAKNPRLNTKKFGTLVIVNNNNNNNNVISGILDPIALENFLKAHRHMSIDELLNSNLVERIKEYFKLDEEQISNFLKQDNIAELKQTVPTYKIVDMRSKEETLDPLKYTYYPNGNGGVIVINNVNNNNNDNKIRRILSGEGVNINNNNSGVALNLPQEEIERLLENAIIVNNDNNNNNAN